MRGHSLALLGGLLAICIGAAAGQTTEGLKVETTSSTSENTTLPDPILDDALITDIPENTSSPSEDTDPTDPILDDALITDIPENASSPSEDTDPTGYSTTNLPYYPPYQTTGRCGQEPRLCCPGRDDSCHRVNCYCDEACYKQFHDCCSDYFSTCQGGDGSPPGFGATGGYTFLIDDPMIGAGLPPGFGTTDEYTFPIEDPMIGDGPPPGFGTPDPFPFDGTVAGDEMSSSPTAQPGTPTTSGSPPTSGSPLTSDYVYWTVNSPQPDECIPTEPGRKFPVMCSGQRSNLVRNCDLYGCGCYRCPRGRKYLKGVDVVCRDGSTVYAPFTGTISTHGMCYGDDADSPGSEGFTFIGSGFCFKIFNVKPDDHDGPVMKGCRLGTMMLMQAQYPRITSHIHMQKCDLSDPTGLL